MLLRWCSKWAGLFHSSLDCLLVMPLLQLKLKSFHVFIPCRTYLVLVFHLEKMLKSHVEQHWSWTSCDLTDTFNIEFSVVVHSLQKSINNSWNSLHLNQNDVALSPRKKKVVSRCSITATRQRVATKDSCYSSEDKQKANSLNVVIRYWFQTINCLSAALKKVLRQELTFLTSFLL